MKGGAHAPLFFFAFEPDFYRLLIPLKSFRYIKIPLAAFSGPISSDSEDPNMVFLGEGEKRRDSFFNKKKGFLKNIPPRMV